MRARFPPGRTLRSVRREELRPELLEATWIARQSLPINATVFSNRSGRIVVISVTGTRLAKRWRPRERYDGATMPTPDIAYSHRSRQTVPRGLARSASRVLQQGLEPVVHMVLDMAMKQRRPWLVGSEVHDHPAVRGS